MGDGVRDTDELPLAAGLPDADELPLNAGLLDTDNVAAGLPNYDKLASGFLDTDADPIATALLLGNGVADADDEALDVVAGDCKTATLRLVMVTLDTPSSLASLDPSADSADGPGYRGPPLTRGCGAACEKQLRGVWGCVTHGRWIVLQRPGGGKSNGSVGPRCLFTGQWWRGRKVLAESPPG